MKKALPLLVGLNLMFSLLQAQSIATVVVSPTNPLACSTLTVTTSGMLNCLNAIFDSTNHSVSGSTVFVNLYFTQPFICLPALAPYTTPHTIPGGTIPPGNYTLSVRTFINLTQFASNNSSLNLPTCCSANSGFTASSLNICTGNAATFFANDTSLSSYTWKNNGVTFSTTSSGSQTFSGIGAFNISLTTSNGTCSTTTSQTLNVYGYPSTNIAQVTPESCPGRNDGSVDLNVTGGTAPYRYLWSSGATTQDLLGIPGGNYMVTVTDTNGCAVMDSAFVLTGQAAVASFTSAPGALICEGDTGFFTNTSTGATNYNWLVNGQSLSQLPDFAYLFSGAGTYSVSLIANNATCFDTATQSLTVSAAPSVSGAPSQTTCPASADGGILLSVSGGIAPYAYLWSTGDTTRDLNMIAAGPYTVNVTDSLGCSTLDTLTVPAGPGFIASFSPTTNTSICPGTSVTFINTSSGGTSYSWYNNGVQVGQAADLTYTFDSTGTFDIVLIGTDGTCDDTASLTMTVYALPQVMPGLTNETCPEDGDGAIDLDVSGGTPPFAYTWSTGAQTQDIVNLSAGFYRVTIVDGNSCTLVDTFEIVTLGGLSAGFIQANLGGGTYGFTDLSDTTAVSWFWDFGDGVNTSIQQNPQFTYDFSGNYEVCLIATDQYGCADTACQLLNISVGIDREKLQQIALYPNPGKESFRVEHAGISGRQVEVLVFDAWGRNVYKQRLVVSERLEVTLKELPAGLYQVWILQEENAYHGKWIKQ